LVDDIERRFRSVDPIHPALSLQFNVQFRASSQQRRDDGLGRVGHGKQFAGLFAFEFDTERREPPHRRRGVERGQDVADDVAPAVEIVGGDSFVGDVAPAPAGDQDFRAQRFGPVEDDNPAAGAGRLGGEDRRGQPRGPTADDGDVG
jgi:hypothetical protein